MTEAGTKWTGSLKSAVGLGTLLADGIGDTIRISLSTFQAEEEVKVAWEILKALKLRDRGPVLIACPTCGRLQFDMDTVVAEVEQRLEAYADPIEVSVLGCAVNSIGEAPPRRLRDHRRQGHGDDLLARRAAGREGARPSDGWSTSSSPGDRPSYYQTRASKILVRDEAQAAEARAWLAENEDATAMTPERIAAMEAEAAGEENAGIMRVIDAQRLDESQSPVARRRFTHAHSARGVSGVDYEAYYRAMPGVYGQLSARWRELSAVIKADHIATLPATRRPRRAAHDPGGRLRRRGRCSRRCTAVRPRRATWWEPRSPTALPIWLAGAPRSLEGPHLLSGRAPAV